MSRGGKRQGAGRKPIEDKRRHRLVVLLRKGENSAVTAEAVTRGVSRPELARLALKEVVPGFKEEKE